MNAAVTPWLLACLALASCAASDAPFGGRAFGVELPDGWRSDRRWPHELQARHPEHGRLLAFSERIPEERLDAPPEALLRAYLAQLDDHRLLFERVPPRRRLTAEIRDLLPNARIDDAPAAIARVDVVREGGRTTPAIFALARPGVVVDVWGSGERLRGVPFAVTLAYLAEPGRLAEGLPDFEAFLASVRFVGRRR